MHQCRTDDGTSDTSPIVATTGQLADGFLSLSKESGAPEGAAFSSLKDRSL